MIGFDISERRLTSIHVHRDLSNETPQEDLGEATHLQLSSDRESLVAPLTKRLDKAAGDWSRTSTTRIDEAVGTDSYNSNMWPFQKINPAKSPKTWEASQQYELRHALSFMDSQFFRDLHADYASGKRNVSVGFRDPLVLQEWFSDSTVAFDEFISDIAGKVCLEIGPCVASQMSGWDVARERHVIEPLLDPIINWQRHHLRKSIYDGLIPHSVAAEVFIEQLAQAVDGAILCRNMLDHTPKWPFVLANIATYAASGCRLLLWTDLDHKGEADEGHYDITPDISAFRRLVQQFGFTIIRERSAPDRDELNWGCFAVRR